MSKYYNIDDLRLLAKKRVPRAVFDYADGAAEDELTKDNNRNAFIQSISGNIPNSLRNKLNRFKKTVIDDKPTIATRKSSELSLAVINKNIPFTIGGSADLTGSNNTLTPELGIFSPENQNGRYIHYGIREHAMAAAMNGISLHGGLIPYGGTFLAFTDYARGAIRLSSLMKIRVIYVMTHDSIGLGEDGPTHQPVEHLAMLRATPNMFVFRPADTVETAETWEIALENKNTPSIIALSRQNLPSVRKKYLSKNLTSYGAYILSEATLTKKVVLVASGSEVSIALSAQKKLENDGIGTRVVSMPCWELFENQETKYQKKVLTSKCLVVGIEAASPMGWDKWLHAGWRKNKDNFFVGMNDFGASAPAGDLYTHFGITAKNIIEKVKEKPGTHAQGIASDIAVSGGVQRRAVVEEALEQGFTGIGISSNFIHVDTRATTPVLWTY